MQKYAVLGFPIRHSVSPQMQGAAFAAAGIEASYVPLEVRPEELAVAFQRLRLEGFTGWNNTVPHKEAAFGLVDELDASAVRAGGVNTVCHRDQRLIGYSTDGYGLLAALAENFAFAPQAPASAVAVLGCGGAGRAAAAELAVSGLTRLVLINRTLARAEAVAAHIQGVAPACETVCVSPQDGAALAKLLPLCQVLLQSTSLGLRPDDALPLDATCLPSSMAVMDMIYRTTPLLAAAQARGCRVADGRWMLLHQGARSFTLWTGRQAPVAAMRAALVAALKA